MADSRGEAAGYYQQQGGNGYGPGPQMQYEQQPYSQPYGQPQYQQQYPPPQNPPYQQKPQYDQGGNNPPPYGYQPPQAVSGEYTFDQAFRIDKPKWNDLWAGILVCASDAFPLRKLLLMRRTTDMATTTIV